MLYGYVGVLAINLAYSCGGRNVPYLDVVLNGAPHVVRFWMGALLVGRQPPAAHLFAFLLVTVAFSCLRRRVEQDIEGWSARQSLDKWAPGALDRVMSGSLIALAAIATWKAPAAPGFSAALCATALVLIVGAHTSTAVRRSLRWVWTH